MALTAPFLGSGTATAGLNVTFNFDCGALDSTKLVNLGLHQLGGVAGKLITAITVDSVNCLANVTQGQRVAEVWCALPASSGVVTVNLTYDNAPTTFSWGAWGVLGSTGAPTDTQSVFTNTDAVRSLAMTVPAGGVALVVGTAQSGAVTTANATEDYDAANTHQYVGAHTTTTGAVSPEFTDVSSMVGFAFAPAATSPALNYDFPNPRKKAAAPQTWLNTFIPPAAAAVPFLPIVWQNPVKAKAQPQFWSLNLLQSVLAPSSEVPFRSVEWRVPGPKVCGAQTWTVNLLLTTLGPVPPAPADCGHLYPSVSAGADLIPGVSKAGSSRGSVSKAGNLRSGITCR